MTLASRKLDEIDRDLIRLTQSGLPLIPAPYAEIAASLGIGEAEVIQRLGRLTGSGVVRRIGFAVSPAVLGMKVEGLTVWDVDDAEVERLGLWVAALDFVSQCDLRLRRRPGWRYNLFAVAHGSSREDVRAKARRIADILGPTCKASDILFSTRILKDAARRPAD